MNGDADTTLFRNLNALGALAVSIVLATIS